MSEVTIKIHPSIQLEDHPSHLSGHFEDVKLIEAIWELVEPYPELVEICLENQDRKPGILYLADKVELSSLGLLDEIVDQDIEVRIVPILHGG